MYRQILIILVIIVTLESVFGDDPPKVTLSHRGVLVGSYMNTINGKTIEAYRGIPYAEPPVNNLRFKGPIPDSPWTGEKLANQDANMCAQQDPLRGVFITLGNEDCLYLNVYTPEREDEECQKPLPVIVFIPGGGFVADGSGSSLVYGPQRLMENDGVIVVTLNYRVGILGFLSTGAADCPGNNGLKDQSLALKWVNKNIRAFGGNPRDVTIYGHSAGAASVTYHMVSPLSKGLFHKAIILSGTDFDPWALGLSSVANIRARKVGTLLNCTNVDEMIECLRTKTADAIVSTLPQFFEFKNNPLIAFPPVIEPKLKGAFLTKHPRDISNPHSNFIPVIISVTADDGVIGSGQILNLYNEDFKGNFSEVLPLILYYDHKPAAIQEIITGKIDNFYFQGIHDWTKENHQNLTNLFTDRFFLSGMTDWVRRRVGKKGRVGKTYVCEYDHRGPFSFSVLLQAGPEYYGTCHGDDLLCIFAFFGDVSIPTGNDATMKWGLPKMLTNFAKTGNPTPEGSNITKWIPATEFPLNYAQLGSKFSENWTLLKNKKGLHEERVGFWKEISSLL